MPLYALGDATPELPAEGDVWIAPDAHVIGRVRLGRGVGIWFGAVVRGDTEAITVGPDSNVQDGAVLHTDPGFPLDIGRDCTIGHRAIVHGCTVGTMVLIGMGATIMNGASIGDRSLVGAGALVTENKHFPEGSLIVGVPARLLRPLDEAEMETLSASARHYAGNARRFAAGLRRLD